jgi:CRISPR/Cas system-associated endonuclease/helicase Cas3
MAVLSNELRNLLTEESLNSILSAGSGPNGHLIPEQEIQHQELINNNQTEEINNFPEKEAVNVSGFENDLRDVQSYIKKNLSRHDSSLEMITSKVNSIIKVINEIEQKIENIKSMPQQTQVNQEVKEEVKKEKQSNPRGVAQLPPELSIESVFNCNGKKFN